MANINSIEYEKEQILQEFRNRGMRITNQRKILLDGILNNQFTCIKEIYFIASKKDKSLGLATVYRMVNLLEELGIIDSNKIKFA